jgi:hypothetical protein
LDPSIVFVCDRTELCPINSTNVQQSIEIVVKITVQSDRYVPNIAESFPLNRKYNFQMVMIRCCPQYMCVRESTRLDRRVFSMKINFPKSNWVFNYVQSDLNKMGMAMTPGDYLRKVQQKGTLFQGNHQWFGELGVSTVFLHIFLLNIT